MTSSDLVKRLREMQGAIEADFNRKPTIVEEAADRIEALEALTAGDDDTGSYMKAIFPASEERHLLTKLGRDFILHVQTMRQIYLEATEACPRAADAIMCLIWKEVITANRAQHFIKEWQAQREKVEALEAENARLRSLPFSSQESDERIKRFMERIAHPNSQSIYTAAKQLENEIRVAIDAELQKGSMASIPGNLGE